jgi:hypothetical protein
VLGRDDVHDHAALEHLGEPGFELEGTLYSPVSIAGNIAFGHVRNSTPGLRIPCHTSALVEQDVEKGAPSVIAAVAGLMLSQAMVAAAAAPTDLRAVLAPPPSSDYVELTYSLNRLVGPFDAHAYAVWDTGGDRQRTSDVETTLASDWFTRGYARTWLKQGTDQALEEFVFEFATSLGAGYWNLQVSDSSSSVPDFRGPLAGGSPIPNSWTAKVSSDGTSGAHWVGFTRGNDTYFVDALSDKDDLTNLALQQADAQYKLAPASTSTTPFAIPSARRPFVPVPPKAVLETVMWLGLGVAALIAAGTAVTILVLGLRQKPSRPPPAWPPG